MEKWETIKKIEFQTQKERKMNYEQMKNEIMNDKFLFV